MESSASRVVHSWRKDDFLISTDINLIPLSTLNAALGSDELYWARALEESQLRRMLENSLCFAAYKLSGTTGEGDPSVGQLVGFTRCVTDYVTFVYLEDVYVEKEYRGIGLGKWMVSCLKEIVDKMPDLRRCMLLTGTSEAVEFYRRGMGFEVLESSGAMKEGLRVMSTRGPAGI